MRIGDANMDVNFRVIKLKLKLNYLAFARCNSGDTEAPFNTALVKLNNVYEISLK